MPRRGRISRALAPRTSEQDAQAAPRSHFEAVLQSRARSEVGLRSGVIPRRAAKLQHAGGAHQPVDDLAPEPRAIPDSVRKLEARLHPLCKAARMLPALTADNGHEERLRLTACLARGEAPVPRFSIELRPVPAAAFKLIDELRAVVEAGLLPIPGSELYLAKLEELDLDLHLLDALGRPRAVRTLAARRYGTGQTQAPTPVGPLPLARCARILLDSVEPEREDKVLPPDGEPESLGQLVRELAAAIGLPVEVRIEPRLSSGAAAGEHTVFVASRKFGRHEAQRLAVHEVLGHLVAAANGRAQPLRVLEWGTAGSFTDQEGVALYLEQEHGVMDGTRLRILAGRVLATDWMHAGASFAECARRLHKGEHFTAAEAIGIAERAYRGGGVARDAAYLHGLLRVHDAIERGQATLDELRQGRVSLEALPAIRELQREGYAASSLLQPRLPSAFGASVTSGRDAASVIARGASA